MAKTKIRSDVHGLYVRAGGYLFRPVHSRHTALAYALLPSPVSTAYREGDTINARHLAGSPLGKVGNETWYAHGSYIDADAKQIPSDQVWSPK